MKEEKYAVVTFKSTHYTIQAEEVFKENNISFKTIPTPREITVSCGLSILFTLEDLPQTRELIDKGELIIDSLYKYTKGGNPGAQIEKII